MRTESDSEVGRGKLFAAKERARRPDELHWRKNADLFGGDRDIQAARRRVEELAESILGASVILRMEMHVPSILQAAATFAAALVARKIG